MDKNKIVTPSFVLDTTLPDWIRTPDNVISEGVSTILEGTQVLRTRYRSENHKNFINFMEKSAESQERLGFGQDILQNLLKYRDFDTYSKEIVQYNILKVNGFIGGSEDYIAPLLTSDAKPILAVEPQGLAQQILAGIIPEDDNLILSEDETEEIELVDGYGFPEENGVILINDEVILYRRREGNRLIGLERGASATTILPTFRDSGQYLYTTPSKHFAGSVVINLSVLFLVSMLDTIHKTYTVGIDSERVVPEVNRSTVLINIKDFFRSKGSKLGIKSLFKFLFAENDVDVFYPGDRMIKPSVSTWNESLIMRTVPVPEVFCNPEENYTTPEKGIGSIIQFKSYRAKVVDRYGKVTDYDGGEVFAEGVIEYASEYQYEDETQYELYLNKDEYEGNVISNPNTKLTRDIFGITANESRRDRYTITVESTLGFPDEGVIFVDNEAITYKSKTPNQFLECTRGYIGVESPHQIGSRVYGPFYVEMRIKDKNGVEHVSRSWPKGIVEKVDIIDGGLLHSREEVVVNGYTGLLDPREQILCTIKNETIYNVAGLDKPVEAIGYGRPSVISMGGYKESYKFNPTTISSHLEYTFIENVDDILSSQDARDIDDGTMPYLSYKTYGVDSIYFNDDYVFVSSSGFPSYTMGTFNRNGCPVDCKIGPSMIDDSVFAVIPRRHQIQDNIDAITYKGTDTIGIFVDGVRAFSNVSPKRLIQGTVGSYQVINGGSGYKNPTVLVDGQSGVAKAVVSDINGSILEIKRISSPNYTINPPVKITSGKDAAADGKFDRFGRITKVNIRNNGQYYIDEPTVVAVDRTGKGKGALLKANVSNGYVKSVTIINSGIDYDDKATVFEFYPEGSGALVKSTTQYYQVNRPVEIEKFNCGKNTDVWSYDKGNGFLYETPGFVGESTPTTKTTFGYTVSPKILRTEKNDIGETHSPILGWAFDGNPIYGPYGYWNAEDDRKGIRQMRSGYVKRISRSIVVPGGSDTIASDPPSVGDYPMGYFVQDYAFEPFTVAEDGGEQQPGDYLASEIPEFTTTEIDELIELENYRGGRKPPNWVLDENNGRVCNTPEFPKDLYPDGVYCYFITVEEDNMTPEFPYIVGKTFNSRPISQNIQAITKRTLSPLPKSVVYSSMMYDDTPLVFDFQNVERLRNTTMKTGDDSYELRISNVSEGSINGVVVQDGDIDNRRVGDYLYFDNEGTSGGGSQAVISEVFGKPIEKTEGNVISTKVISHYQRIDLSDNNEIYTFNKDSVYDTFSSTNTSKVRVMSYNTSDNELDVFTITDSLPETGDKMRDSKRRLLDVGTVMSLDIPETENVLYLENTRYIKPGQTLIVKNGSPDGEFISNEKVSVITLYNNNSVLVARSEESREIADQTEVVIDNLYTYEITTEGSHNLLGGDEIVLNNSVQEGLNGTYQIQRLSSGTFFIFVDKLYEPDSDIYYTTHSRNSTGVISDIKLTSGGYGYSSLPRILGVYNEFIDRAIVKPILSGSTITGFEVEDGGFRYNEDVIVVIEDFTGNGHGAIAKASVVDSIITSVDIVDDNVGIDYVEPIIYLVQPEGKFICTTDNIGKIHSMAVVNPGRDLTIEGTNRPEIITDTKCVVKFTEGTEFVKNQEVFQGSPNLMTATARVKEYDSDRQIVTLIDVIGNIKQGELLMTTDGVVSEVITEGDQHSILRINGTSLPDGEFIDDTSKTSELYPVIQDSYRYQWFSYVISSDLQQNDYDTLVQDIIHPTGFVRFADLTVHDFIDLRNSYTTSINDDITLLSIDDL